MHRLPRRAVLFVLLAFASCPPATPGGDGEEPAGVAGLHETASAEPPRAEASAAMVPVAAERTAHVHDSARRPVPGARVSLWSGDERLVTVETDAEGRASLTAIPRAPDRVTVAAPGFLRFVRALDEGAASSAMLDIPLDRGATLALVATDRRTGRPVTSFRALVVPMDELAPGATAARDADLADALAWQRIASDDGTGRIGGLPPRPVLLVVQADGFRPEIFEGLTERSGPVAVRFDDTGCRPIDVADAGTGGPVAGAVAGPRLAALEGPMAHLGAFASSDAAGRMTYCPLPGSAGEAFIVHGDYAPRRVALAPAASLASAVSPASDGQPQRVLLDAGGTVEGTVRDGDGRPLARVPVAAEDALGRTTPATTDPLGRFRLERLPAGRVRIACRLERRGPVRRTVTLEAGGTATVDLAPGTPARVEFVDEDDRPLRDQDVVLLTGPAGAKDTPPSEFDASRVRTDADGAITVAEDELKSGALVAVPGENRLAIVRPAPPADPRGGAWRAALEGREIRGRVRAGARGPGLAGALLSCARGGVIERRPDRGPLWIDPVGASIRADAPLTLAGSDRGGAFTLRVPPWCARITVEGPPVEDDERPWAVRRVLPRDDLEIALERGRRIVVTVVPTVPAVPTLPVVPVLPVATAPGAGPASSGLPLVELRRPGAPGAAQSTLAEAGRAILDPPDDGPWLILARPDGLLPAGGLAPAGVLAPAVSGPRPIDTDHVEQITLTPEPGAFVEIPPGLPLLDERGLDWSTLASRTGDRLGPVPLGAYRVRVDGVERKVTLRDVGSVVRVDVPREGGGESAR